MQYQMPHRGLQTLEIPDDNAPNYVQQLNQLDPQHLAPPDQGPIQVADGDAQLLMEHFELLGLGEFLVVSTHELIQVHPIAVVVQPPENYRQELQEPPQIFGHLAHFWEVLDVDIDIECKFAQLHSLDDVQADLPAQLLGQIFLLLEVGLEGRLGEMGLGHFGLFEIGYVVPSADLDLAQSLQEVLETTRQVAYFLQGVGFRCVVFEELLPVVAGPRELLGDEMIEKDAECEGVGFEGVDIFLQSLGGHVEGTADHVHLFDLR